MIKITVHRYSNTTKGQPSRVQVMIYPNEERDAAIRWLIEDSYMENEEVRRVVWEVDDQPLMRTEPTQRWRTRGA